MNRKKKKGIVLIQKGNQYFSLNGEPVVDYDKMTKNVEVVIILPAKEEIN